MAPHNRGSLENIPLERQDNGLRPVIRNGAGDSGENPHLELPALEVLEQPAVVSRFRYSRESPTNGSIHGVHNTEQVKTYPTIRINYNGPVKIRVSCVNKNPPYKPHPHKIVGRSENCSEGVYTRLETITERNRIVQLMNIGIQCTKREHIAKALQDRARLKVDPFGTGYDNPSSFTSTMLHYVRLAIEVLIPDATGQLTILLAAVHTDVITDLPTKMLISSATPRHGSAHGGTQITLLTTKLPCNEIKVRFQDESVDWQVDVRPVRIHHLLSVVVDTPPYCNPDTDTPAHVTMRLVRPATGDPDIDKHQVGEPYKYIYMPGPDLDLTNLQDVIQPKRQRTEDKVLLHPLQHDLDYPLGNAPPEPQPSTSASLEINTFLELDKWFYKTIHTQPSQPTPGPQNSLNGIQPQPIQVRPPNSSQGLSFKTQYSQTDRPKRQQSQESLERNSQKLQNYRPAASNSTRGNHQTGQQFASHSQTRMISNQDISLEPNNVVNSFSPGYLVPQQALIPQSSQNNFSTPNSIGAQKESCLKRTHSQMDNANLRGSYSTIWHSQTEIPFSQMEPRLPSETQHFQNSHSLSTASNPTGSSQGDVAYIFEPGPLFQEIPTNNKFTEFPPNEFEVFETRTNHLLIPEIVQTPRPQDAQYPLIDLTEAEHVSEPSLTCNDLRYFENQPQIWQEGTLERIFSLAPQEYQGNQQLETNHEVLPAENTSNEQVDPSTEVLSLSAELAKILF